MKRSIARQIKSGYGLQRIRAGTRKKGRQESAAAISREAVVGTDAGAAKWTRSTYWSD